MSEVFLGKCYLQGYTHKIVGYDTKVYAYFIRQFGMRGWRTPNEWKPTATQAHTLATRIIARYNRQKELEA